MMICSNCNSQNTRNVDGLYYCEDCGTQNRNFREIETELDAFGGNSQRLKVSKSEKNKVKKEKIKAVVPEDALRHLIVPEKDYPAYLRRSGERLATATYLIVRISTILHKEFELPEKIVEASLSLFQQYLAIMNIAFVDTEVSPTEEEGYVIDFKRTFKEIEMDRKAQTEQLKEKRRQQQLEERSQLPMWQQSFMEQTQPILEEDSEFNESHLLNLEVIKTINTGLTERSYRMAHMTPINIDMILCIIYLACHYLGCTWILLSDLFRWHRENRFRIMGRHLYNIAMTYVSGKKGSDPKRYSRFSRTNIQMLSVYEAYRVLSYLVQNVQIPQILHLPTIEQVLNRLVFDLNLPPCFWKRLRFVLEMLPPITTEYSIDKLEECCAFRTREEVIEKILKFGAIGKGRHKYFSDESFYAFITTGFEKNYERSGFLALLPIETKAAAIIILTLKLMFALDDSNEYKIDEFSAKQPNNFEFIAWLYQVEFRNHARNGIAVENITSPTFCSKVEMVVPKFLASFAIPGRIFRDSSDPWILPKRGLYADADKPFYNCFPVDNLGQLDTNSSLSRFAPLRFHAKYGLEIGSGTPNIDRRRLEVYLFEFNKTDMDFDDFTELAPENVDEKNGTSDAECRKLFPAFAKIKTIPSTGRNTRHVKKDRIEFSTTSYIFRDESRTFSESFSRLLSSMACVIGEKIDVLYRTFVLLETQLLQNNESDDLFKLYW